MLWVFIRITFNYYQMPSLIICSTAYCSNMPLPLGIFQPEETKRELLARIYKGKEVKSFRIYEIKISKSTLTTSTYLTAFRQNYTPCIIMSRWRNMVQFLWNRETIMNSRIFCLCQNLEEIYQNKEQSETRRNILK